MNKVMKTKVGEEPRLVVQLKPDTSTDAIFIVGDGRTVCQTSTVCKAMQLLLEVYFVLNMNYPDYAKQLLGLIQLTVLQDDFPLCERSAAFTMLKESL